MSGCPFFSTTKPIKQPFSNIPKPSSSDPGPFIIERKYEQPYFSPYKALFVKYELTANKPLSLMEFHLKNSIFHHSYVTKFRISDISSRVLMANELRESGNRNYNKGHYSKACMCYEHAYGLFNYYQEVETNFILTKVNPAQQDLDGAPGILQQILVNYAYGLIALGHFNQAEILLKEAKTFGSSSEVKAAEIVLVLTNIESDFEDIFKFSGNFPGLLAKNKNFLDLEKSFNAVLYKIQQERCQFWVLFFKEYSYEARTKPLSNFDLEFIVVSSLNEKYEKMMEYYQETENFEKITAERNEVLKVLALMKAAKKVKITDNDDIMLAHAKSAGISLEHYGAVIRFEAAKRSFITKVFNQGSFNKRLLYDCIQQAMAEFEQKAEVKDRTDLELQFWQRNLVACVVFAVIAFLMSASPF